MNHEGYAKAADHWKSIDAASVKMPREAEARSEIPRLRC